MTPIEAHPQVRQELQSRGIGAETGVFGNHRVQLGHGAPVRLDAIRSAPVPFAGFRQVTRVARGQAGVAQTASAALSALTRPNGRLDAGALLGQIRAMRTHMERLGNLGRLQGDPGEHALRAFAPHVENMSNEELSAVWQCFMSGEMDLLQTALRAEGQLETGRDARISASDIFDIQALILKEVSDRIVRGENMPGAENLRPLSGSFGPLCAPDDGAPDGIAAGERHADHISHANLRTLVEVGAQSAAARERTDSRMAGDLAARNLPGLSARAMGDVMRSAELTMNIDERFLFDTIMANPDAHAANVFHMREQGLPDHRRTNYSYLAPREAVETLLFPELYTGRGGSAAAGADEHPAYAALNLNRQTSGAAASSYGGAVIVLRPETAQRATYTVDDSFYNTPVSFSRARRSNFYARLQTLDAGMLPTNFATEAAHPQSELHHAFETYFDSLDRPGADTSAFTHGDLPQTVTEHLNGHPSISVQDSQNRVNGELIAAFGDAAAARGRMATHDSLEALLPGMITPTLNSFARAALHANPDDGRVGLQGARYIEAQIQGGIIPSRDIAEIRVNFEAFRNPLAALEQARSFTTRTGIPVVPITRAQGTRDGEATMDAIRAVRTFNAAHLNRATVTRLADAAAGNPRSRIDALVDGMRVSAATRAILKRLGGNALILAMDKFQSKVADWMAHPENRPGNMAQDIEEELVQQAFDDAVGAVLKHKAALLGELDKLEFETAEQKADFAAWIMNARAIRSPEELRLLHAAAWVNAATLRDLAVREAAPSPEEVMRALASVIHKNTLPLADFFEAQRQSGIETGTEDQYAELSRIASLGVSLLRHGPDGARAIASLSGLMDRPEQLLMFRRLIALDDPSRTRTPLEFARPINALRVFVDSMLRAGGRGGPLPPFIGELAAIPAPTRETLRELAPGFVEALDRAHPCYPAFPAPAMGNLLPQSDARRRAFLTGFMLAPATDPNDPASAGPYVRHEMTFDSLATHGRGHVARAYVLASAFCNILREQGVNVDRNAVLLGIAGHDMGRENGGADYWEAQSAERLIAAMRNSFGADAAGESYEQALTDCIVHGENQGGISQPRGRTLEALLVNAADSLEIVRVRDIDDFRMEHFRFLRDGPGASENILPQAAQRMRAGLLREAEMLQRLTDPSCMYRPLRNRLNLGIAEAMNAGREAEAAYLRAQQNALIDGIEAFHRERRAQSGEDFMNELESAIRLNPDRFPLLTAYYINIDREEHA
jgi:hypothetical protein